MYGSWTENVVLWRIFFKDSFETHNTFYDVYNYWGWDQRRHVPNHLFGCWDVLLRSENRFVKLLNNNERKCKTNSTVN